MSFTCPEFPGRVFSSVQELIEFRKEKQKLRDTQTKRTKVVASKVKDATGE